MWMFRFATPPGSSAAPNPDADDSVVSGADEASDVVMGMLPWAVSVLFHVGLVLLAIFIVWSTVASSDEEEIIIPIANLSRTPGVKVQVQVTQRVQNKSASRRSVTNIKTSKSTLTNKVNLQSTLIGVQGASASKASPFGETAGAGNQFSTAFMGNAGGNAKKVAFLIDASGSLVGTFPFVILELKKTIHKLSDKQAFTVVFFQGDNVIEVPPARLKKATAETRGRVIEWIDKGSNIIPRGETNPLKAIRVVLKYKPQVLFILSDNITGMGKYELDQEILLAEIKRANAAGTKISTIQFLYKDPLEKIPGKKGTLEMIALRTGGNFKFVDGKELRIR